MALDIEFFVFTRSIAKFIGLLNIFLSLSRITDVARSDAQHGVGTGKIGVELDGTFEVRNSGFFVEAIMK